MPGKRILVTGASGLLGGSLVRTALDRGAAVAALSRHPIAVAGPGLVFHQIEASDPQHSSAEWLKQYAPDVVVHAAAITDVDWCEAHPEDAALVNARWPGTVAGAARDVGARFVYVSTDGVFDGDRGPYNEHDVPRPLNVYAQCKLDGESRVRDAHADALVVRTNLFGPQASKRGLAEWMLSRFTAGQQVPAFEDVTFSPLYVDDLAGLIFDLGAVSLGGLYHVGSADSCSKLTFARWLAAEFGFDAGLIVPGSVAAAGLRAARPRNTTLDVSKVSSALSRSMPTIRDGIARFRQRRLESHPIQGTHVL